MPDPLAETAARLRALVPAFPDTYDVVQQPTGPGWVRLDAVPVARWCAEARERGNPRRLASVAAAAVGGALAHAVLARVTAALALDRRAWDLAADALTVPVTLTEGMIATAFAIGNKTGATTNPLRVLLCSDTAKAGLLTSCATAP